MSGNGRHVAKQVRKTQGPTLSTRAASRATCRGRREPASKIDGAHAAEKAHVNYNAGSNLCLPLCAMTSSTRSYKDMALARKANHPDEVLHGSRLQDGDGTPMHHMTEIVLSGVQGPHISDEAAIESWDCDELSVSSRLGRG